jgi:hypothetical protein
VNPIRATRSLVTFCKAFGLSPGERAEFAVDIVTFQLSVKKTVKVSTNVGDRMLP